MSVTWEWQRLLKVLLLRSTASLAGSLWQAAENQDPSQSLPGALCEQGRVTVERWIFFWNLTAFFLRILLYPDPALLLQANCSSRADVDPAAFSSPGRSSGFQTILFTRQTLEPFLQETYFTDMHNVIHRKGEHSDGHVTDAEFFFKGNALQANTSTLPDGRIAGMQEILLDLVCLFSQTRGMRGDVWNSLALPLLRKLKNMFSRTATSQGCGIVFLKTVCFEYCPVGTACLD